jgi:fucose permease
LIFVGNAFGFIFAALFMDSLRAKLGTAKTLLLAEAFIIAGYVPIVCTAPFPVVVICFFLVGFGMSINIAMGNIFCGSLQNGTAALGAMHGFYGIGGTIGPLIATAIVTVAGEVWSRYYFLTLGFGIVNAALATWSFWNYEEELGVGPSAQLLREAEQATADAQIMGMFSALRTRLVLLGALFIFAYQGAEVSISGWIISFLIAARNGDPSSVGYVTAGFWAGITIGRFVLSSPAHKIGEKLFVYLAVVVAAVFEVLVWWVPHVVGDAVAVAIVGLLLGPVYPCAAAVFMRGMARKERISGMGVISAFGSSGGAVAPFTTGILAQAVGTWVLHPIVIALFAVMMVCWYALPVVRKRTE